MSGGNPGQETQDVSKRTYPACQDVPCGVHQSLQEAATHQFWPLPALSLEATTEGHSPFLPMHFPPFWKMCFLRSSTHGHKEFFSISPSNESLFNLSPHSELGSFLLVGDCWQLSSLGPLHTSIPLHSSSGTSCANSLASVAFAYIPQGLDFKAFHHLWVLLWT